MPVDASIYGSIQQPANPLDAYGKALQLKTLMGQQKLQELQTTKTQRDLDEEQQVRDVFARAAPGAALETLLPDVYKASPKTGVEMQGKVLTQKKTQADLDKTRMEIEGKALALHRDDLANVKTPQDAAAWVMSGFQDPVLGPLAQRMGKTPEQVLATIPQDPEGLQGWVQRNALGASKYLETQNANREHALNRETTIRGQDLAAKTAREGHLVTERGQNLTDSRQRELNGIMEGSTNTPSPELVKSIATGEVPLNPPPTNARNPIMLERYGKILAAVKAENPNWSAEMHPTIKKTVAAFAAGKEGQTVKALNTATDHLETMRELVAAVKNGNIQTFNKIANQWASSTGNPAPANLSVAAQVIGGEIVKGIVGAGGGTGERERAENAFSNVKSPADAEGAINTVTKLMGGQFKGMRQQYEAGTYGRKDFAEKYLTPAARNALEAASGAPKAEAGKSKVVKWGDL